MAPFTFNTCTTGTVVILASRLSIVISKSRLPLSNPLGSFCSVAIKPFSTTPPSSADTWKNISVDNSCRRHINRSIIMSNSMGFFATIPKTALTSTTVMMSISHQLMSTSSNNRKAIDAKNAKRLKIQQKKKIDSHQQDHVATTSVAEGTRITNEDYIPTDRDEEGSSSLSPFTQHQEWVKFQQSLKVSGFQTGQVTATSLLKKSTRGGKQARKKREKELARLGAFEGISADGRQGAKLSAAAAKFPAIRYSPDETEKLIKLAYETLPRRTGKRGTKNLRRQANRWRTVRKIRSDYKAQLMQAHRRRMEHRKYKRDRTDRTKLVSVDQRRRDLDYQGKILQRWIDRFHTNISGSNNRNSENENVDQGGGVVQDLNKS